MATALTWLDLQSPDLNVFNAAWQEFFLDEELVRRFLQECADELVHATLNAGHAWQGGGWNSTRASKELHRLSGVPLVSKAITEYAHLFLFSLALTRNLDIPVMELSAETNDSDEVKAAEKTPIAPADVHAMSDDEDEENDTTAERLPWQEEHTPLPGSLLACVQAATGGTRLPWKQVLAGVPVYQQLKWRAEDNNHGGRGGEQRCEVKFKGGEESALGEGLQGPRGVS